jgi:Tol biopolymer transport system component
VPQWSPDGRWLMFLCGEHYNCHPHVVRPDGTGLRKLADRKGYRGVVAILDVPDFHGGSSDVPAWSADGSRVYYTAKVGDGTELMDVSLEGKVRQLTTSKPGVLNYQPHPSPDGKWVAFGSNRDGSRQLYVMPAEGGELFPITRVKPGWGAMWAYWQPAPGRPARQPGEK